MTLSKIDIKENRLTDIDKDLLGILLKDNTTKKNLLWATNAYDKKGSFCSCDSHITPDLITGYYGSVIKPRTEKSERIQSLRSREKAEVFTPSWVCNAQNNLIDNAWFGASGVFNNEKEKTWETNHDRIIFPNQDNKTWKDYICSVRLEITCGESPYITSRYDSVTGEYISVKNRIGFLDRKLRVVGENTSNRQEWIEWATRAVKSTYGYDWQGDNVLLSRENVLYTVMEHYQEQYLQELDKDIIVKIAKIISWNIWQMDGLKFVVPYSCKPMPSAQISFFNDESTTQPCEGCAKNNPYAHIGVYCKIMDWDEKKAIRFIDLLERKDSRI